MLKKIFSIVLLTGCLLAVLPFSSVSAQDSYVSPAILNLNLTPGETTKGTYSYFNTTGEEENIVVSVTAFEPTDGDHGSTFTDKNGNAIVSPITNWIKFEKKSYVIGKESKIDVNFEIDTPADAKSGKYFVALFNQVNGVENASGASVNKKIGVRLVAEVAASSEKEPSRSSINLKSPIFYAMVIIVLLAIILLWGIIVRRNRRAKAFFEENKPHKANKKIKK